MALTCVLQSNVRKTAAEVYNAGVQNVDQNARGDLAIVQSLPPHTELARLGNSWSLQMLTTAAFNSVAAYPSTRAELVLYNGEPTGGKVYLIDTIWACSLVTLAVASSMTIVAQISAAGIAAPTDAPTHLITSRVGKGTYNGFAKRAVANAATYAVANKWTVVGQTAGHPSATVGAGCLADVCGRFILTPGATLCMNVVVSTAVVTSMIMGCDWYEVQLDMA